MHPRTKIRVKKRVKKSHHRLARKCTLVLPIYDRTPISSHLRLELPSPPPPVGSPRIYETHNYWSILYCTCEMQEEKREKKEGKKEKGGRGVWYGKGWESRHREEESKQARGCGKGQSLFGKNGTVALGDRFCCENDLLSVLKRKEKGHLYGRTERNCRS